MLNHRIEATAYSLLLMRTLADCMKKFKTIATWLFVLLFLAAVVVSLYFLSVTLLDRFSNLDSTLATGILTAATTILVATLTVMIGRHYERKKDHEAAFRETKIEIYDEFLQEFMRLFYGSDSAESLDEDSNDELVAFLREWQRKMILWGGQDVLKQYIDWVRQLRSGPPNAQTLFKTEDLFRAIRKDLGHKSWRLERGSFLRFLLKESDLFLSLSKSNPNLTLEELAKFEEAANQLRANKASEATGTSSAGPGSSS